MPLIAGFDALLSGDLEDAMEAAATRAALELVERLSGSGSGVQYAGLPNRSSATGEYPATQSGDLVNSIDARADDSEPLTWAVGAFDAPEYAAYLEFGADDAPAGVTRTTDVGQRQWLSRTLEDADVQALMRDAIEATP